MEDGVLGVILSRLGFGFFFLKTFRVSRGEFGFIDYKDYGKG